MDKKHCEEMLVGLIPSNMQAHHVINCWLQLNQKKGRQFKTEEDINRCALVIWENADRNGGKIQRNRLDGIIEQYTV